MVQLHAPLAQFASAGSGFDLGNEGRPTADNKEKPRRSGVTSMGKIVERIIYATAERPVVGQMATFRYKITFCIYQTTGQELCFYPGRGTAMAPCACSPTAATTGLSGRPGPPRQPGWKRPEFSFV